MFDWDTSWNCQSGRLTNEELELPWFDDDLCFLPVDPPVKSPIKVRCRRRQPSDGA